MSLASIAEYIGAHTMVRQQRAQPVTTTTPAGVHITTQVFAVAGTNQWHILTWIKDADCDPMVGIMSRVSDERGVSFLIDLGHPKFGGLFLSTSAPTVKREAEEDWALNNH